MSFTKHSNLELVEKGVDNWDAPINENFDAVDRGPTVFGIAGETLSRFKVVYLESDGKLHHAIAGTTGDISSRFVGFTRESYDLNENAYAQHAGWIKDVDWSLSVSDPYYLSAITPGEISTSKPSGSTLVGFAIGTNEILIKPWVELDGVSSEESPGPIGSMRMFSSATVPSNWFMCYGQSKDKATYIDLFNVIGYTYGGSGANFNLPDMRGYTSIGLDNMGGSSAGRVSGATSLNYTIGTENHTLSESEIPAHTHTYTQNSGEGNGAGNSGGADSGTQTRDMSTVGSSSAHNNMQPWLALNWMIKY